MAEAVGRAADDAGSLDVVTAATSVRVPRGFWHYNDPGRLVAERVGASGARSILVELGILQQTLVNDACRSIASGEDDIAIVVGGEARYRQLRAQIAGVDAPETEQEDGVCPDEQQRPAEPIYLDVEAERGLIMPVRAFACLDVAIRAHEGVGIDEHRDQVARLWSAMSRVAAHNAYAWRPEGADAATVRGPGPKNPMLAFPYTKLMNSSWNVDQAAALIFTSVGRARALGLDSDAWVFPHAGTEANHVVPVSQRATPHRSPGAEAAGRACLDLGGVGVDDIAHLDLYSCFPASVRQYLRALDITDDRPVTVTGGMAFAGGPLNNYVLQSTVRMAEVLREDPGEFGLVTAVSGMLNKQGYGLYSTAPAAEGFRSANVTAEVAAADPPLPFDADATGPVRVVTYTVLFEGDEPSEALAVCETADGTRALATSTDRTLAAAMVAEEFCGRSLRVDDGATLVGA